MSDRRHAAPTLEKLALQSELESVARHAGGHLSTSTHAIPSNAETAGSPTDTTEPPVQEYDPAAAIALAEEYGFEVIGLQLD